MCHVCDSVHPPQTIHLRSNRVYFFSKFSLLQDFFNVQLRLWEHGLFILEQDVLSMLSVRGVTKYLRTPGIYELSVPLCLASHAVWLFENGEEIFFTTFSTAFQFTCRTVHRSVLSEVEFITTHLTRHGNVTKSVNLIFNYLLFLGFCHLGGFRF